MSLSLSSANVQKNVHKLFFHLLANKTKYAINTIRYRPTYLKSFCINIPQNNIYPPPLLSLPSASYSSPFCFSLNVIKHKDVG